MSLLELRLGRRTPPNAWRLQDYDQYVSDLEILHRENSSLISEKELYKVKSTVALMQKCKSKWNDEGDFMMSSEEDRILALSLIEEKYKFLPQDELNTQSKARAIQFINGKKFPPAARASGLDQGQLAAYAMLDSSKLQTGEVARIIMLARAKAAFPNDPYIPILENMLMGKYQNADEALSSFQAIPPTK